ncbi:alpha/beta hydrolase [Ostreiculturibacter nitratireducens]|uniref:alpha/beta fold hydrolase n=1 Tax=Ostreiculturibacter nitratireducens TaxID=3075226 RepID=UPI0031B62010
MLSRRGVLLGGLGLVAVTTGGGIAVGYRRSMREAAARISPDRSLLIETRHGPLEYAEAGSGPPVLFLHGTGGGFDQGLDMGSPLVERGYRIIAPSRFGYLRSSFPEDPGPETQADALADLLDHLGIDRVAVSGGSAGAIPAIGFAIRYPARTAALLPIVPAVYAPGRPAVEPWGPVQRWLAEAALKSDFVFWAAITAAPDTMTGALLATDPALIHAAGPAEEARVRQVLEGILPISARAKGLLNDAAATGRPMDFDYESVHAPTLVISLEDDRFLTAESARHIAGRIPDARLIVYPDGGHVWVGREAELFDAVDSFLRETGYA